MHVTALSIRHFRNLDRLDWQPAPGINLIWGENGQGKTNLLEALHLVLTGRSFRTRRDDELLPWGRPESREDPTLAQAELLRRHGARRLRLTMGRGWKRAFADGQWLPSLAALLGEAALVTFTPEEATLFKGPPAARRRWLDMTLCQISRDYLETLLRYSRALRQANALLRQAALRGGGHGTAGAREGARAYFPTLAQAGARLMCARETQLADAAPTMTARWNALGGAGTLELAYDPDVRFERGGAAAGDPAERAERYHERLERELEPALRQGMLPFGVHRDDLCIRLEGRDLRKFGSQGQHRLAALALKLESASWIADGLGDPPLLLLDDFGSELDPRRRAAVLDGLRGAMQVFITATTPADLGGAGGFDLSCRVREGGLAID